MGNRTATAPRERPIIFSTPMVKALLAGTKTQTRRPVKGATGAFWDHAAYKVFVGSHGQTLWHDARGLNVPHGPRVRCPFGVPGDRLWVREALARAADNSPVYFADGALVAGSGPRSRAWSYRHKMTPLFMPRWASRLLLEVVAVRVERLWEISEADALAEGAEPMLVPPDGGSCPHVEGYRSLWESINGAGSWGPTWVWVIEFKRVEPVAGGGGA